MMQNNGFEHEILKGLLASRKAISPKYLYDEKGSELFESITKLEEYYPTRSETEILKNYASEMAEWIGKQATIIEPGCGSCTKVRYLLSALQDPVAYVGMDISKEMLLREASRLHDEFPAVPIFAVPGDFTEKLEVPKDLEVKGSKKVIFFPGSTIGNLNPTEALGWLKQAASVVGRRGGLLIGVDTKKDPILMNLAYDDPHGVTAEFNLNLLDRMNRELEASFDREQFYHSAFYDENRERVEMHLVSKIPQKVKIKDQEIQFEQDETIHTESSYKYSPKEFSMMARRAGFDLKNLWQDSRRLFCVYYFERI